MSSESWYLQRGKSRAIGPFSTEEIVEGIASGEIPKDSMVCAVDGKHWLPLHAVEAFRNAASSGPLSTNASATATGSATASATSAGSASAAESETASAKRSAPESAKASGIRSAFESATESAARHSTNAAVSRVRRAQSGGESASPSHRGLDVVSALAAGMTMLSIAQLGGAMAPNGAMRALFDVVRPLRLEMAVSGALGVVAWTSAYVGVRRVRRGDGEGASLAAAALAPALAIVALGARFLVHLTRPGAFLLATVEDVSRARVLVAVPLAASFVALAAAVAVLGRMRPKGPLRAIALVAALAVASGVAARFGTLADDHVRIAEGSPIAVPLFDDDETLRAYVRGVRAGASGASTIDLALERAVFVPPGTRARVLEERVLGDSSGPIVARRLRVLEGPDAGRTLLLAVR